MDRYLSENLLDGEYILWKGRSEPFRLFAPPYSFSLPILWSLSLAMLAAFSLLFIPFAQRMRVAPLQMLFWIMLVTLIPISICIHSFVDKNMIEKHILYIFTNYRAITMTPREINSMMIDASTPCRLESLPDGNEILYIGDACLTTAYTSRANTVTGIRRDSQDANRITGLIFYGLRGGREICRKYTPFANL